MQIKEICQVMELWAPLAWQESYDNAGLLVGDASTEVKGVLISLDCTEEVVEEVASFPAGDHDDYVDSVSMALMRFRQGGYIRTTLDEPDDEILLRYRNANRKPYY